MNLVDDDGLDGAQCLGRLRGKDQIERLGSDDENLGGMTRKAGPLALRRVTGAHADERLVEWNTHAPRHIGHAGKRRAQVALHVHCQRFQRRNVHDAAALPLLSASLLFPRFPGLLRPVFLIPDPCSLFPVLQH
jgi:hypothetical protein